jgi:hypothetical protein
MTIGQPILLLIFAPALALMVFAGRNLSERFSALGVSVMLQSGERAVFAVDALVGQWQRERGRSRPRRKALFTQYFYVGESAPLIAPGQPKGLQKR